MRKKEIIYTSSGEIVRSSMTQFAGRFHDDKGYGLYAYGKMVSMRTDFKFPEKLTKADIGSLVLLSRRIQPVTNTLVYEANKGVKPMKHKHIASVINVSGEQGYRFTKRMKDMGIIKEVDVPVLGGSERRLVMNPLYFMAGKYVSDELYWMFQEELDVVFSKWIRDEYKQRRDNL